VWGGEHAYFFGRYNGHVLLSIVDMVALIGIVTFSTTMVFMGMSVFPNGMFPCV